MKKEMQFIEITDKKFSLGGKLMNNIYIYLSKIKKKMSKNKIGIIIIGIYKNIYVRPMNKMFALKFALIKDKVDQIHFFSNEETINMLKNEQKSLSRFGDGEIAWIHKDAKAYFGQSNSEELSRRLKEVLLSNESKVLIGIPDFFGTLKYHSKERQQSRNAHLGKYYYRWMDLVDTNKKYSDSLITRTYNGLDNFDSKRIFELWKSVWYGKNVIIIEGSQTRFGVGNDLLENAQSVKRIIAPSENAYSKYNEILNFVAVNNKKSNNDLYLIALGPTATILSYDIALLGCQAIDIGHLDIEYEWYLKNAKAKIPIKGKYVNEAGGTFEIDLDNEILKEYHNEIIKVI